MSVLALTTSLFNAYDTAAVQAQLAAREAARARSKAALSEVKTPAKPAGSGYAPSRDDAVGRTREAAEPAPDLQLIRKTLAAHTVDVQA